MGNSQRIEKISSSITTPRLRGGRSQPPLGVQGEHLGQVLTDQTAYAEGNDLPFKIGSLDFEAFALAEQMSEQRKRSFLPETTPERAAQNLWLHAMEGDASAIEKITQDDPSLLEKTPYISEKSLLLQEEIPDGAGGSKTIFFLGTYGLQNFMRHMMFSMEKKESVIADFVSRVSLLQAPLRGRNLLTYAFASSLPREAMECTLNTLVGRQLLNRPDFLGETPLCLAAQSGEKEWFFKLIEKGADLAIRNAQGRTPLEEAIWNGHFELALEIYEKIGWQFIGYDVPMNKSPLSLLVLNGKPLGETKSFQKLLHAMIRGAKEKEDINALDGALLMMPFSNLPFGYISLLVAAGATLLPKEILKKTPYPHSYSFDRSRSHKNPEKTAENVLLCELCKKPKLFYKILSFRCSKMRDLGFCAIALQHQKLMAIFPREFLALQLRREYFYESCEYGIVSLADAFYTDLPEDEKSKITFDLENQFRSFKNNNPDVFDYLFNKWKINLHRLNSEGQFFLHFMAEIGADQVIARVLKNKTKEAKKMILETESLVHRKKTPLQYAIYQGTFSSTRYFLEHEEIYRDIDWGTYHQLLSLSMYSSEGSLVIEFLLVYGVERGFLRRVQAPRFSSEKKRRKYDQEQRKQYKTDSRMIDFFDLRNQAWMVRGKQRQDLFWEFQPIPRQDQE